MTNEQGKRIDLPLSAAVRKQNNSAPNQCYYNCVTALRLVDGACYVEGWILYSAPGSRAFEHAWLELPDGRILELTLPEEHTPDAAAYHVARRFTPLEAFAGYVAAGKHEDWLRFPVWSRGDNHNPEWVREWLAEERTLQAQEQTP